MKYLKFFENFNISSADDYIKEVLTIFGLTYEEGVYDDAGNICVKSSEFTAERTGMFYIFASHPDKEFATYHITFIVNGQIESRYNTTSEGLEASIKSSIEEYLI